MRSRGFWSAILPMVLVVLMGLFASAGPAVSDDAQTSPAASQSQGDYQLGSGDKLRVIVFGENDLGGEYDVDGSGYVRLPLIGQIKAAGLTVHGFEHEVAKLLEDGYLRDPKVSVEVINYRPFYIIGEVNRPGQYAYVNDMNVLNAVALAGGYTPRANTSDVYIQRNGTGGEKEFPADDTTKILPGDILRIPERFF